MRDKVWISSILNYRKFWILNEIKKLYFLEIEWQLEDLEQQSNLKTQKDSPGKLIWQRQKTGQLSSDGNI